MRLTSREKYWILDRARERPCERKRLILEFTAKFGRQINRDTIWRIIRENNPTRNVCLKAVEKYWLVEHVEKWKLVSRERLAQIFRDEFGRSIHIATIRRHLKQKAEIIQEYASWAEKASVKIKPVKSDCTTEPEPYLFLETSLHDKTNLTIAEKYWIVERVTNYFFPHRF